MHSELEATANNIRIASLMAIHAAGSGHPGGTLSACDLMTGIWVRHLVIDNNHKFSLETSGNRFILSKGHACAALYALAAYSGLISKKSLLQFRQLDSALQGHPHVSVFPWANTSTGSLGQGFSVALGMAMGMRHKDIQGNVYVILGDGELQEGEVWEAAMCAAHYRLENLCVIIDRNQLQSDTYTADIMEIEPLQDKWTAFGWHVVKINGHDFFEIDDAIRLANKTQNRPTVIIANTIKGKGISFMENNPEWHGSLKIRDNELRLALTELGVKEQSIAKYFDGSYWND